MEPIRYRELAPVFPEGAIDLPSLVPGDGPLELDIGFGRGASIFSRAAAAPDSRIIGLEVKAKLVHRVDERRKRLGLDRVRVFLADAREALTRTGPDASVARAFLHFPDPWWKKRHAKRRVLDRAFVDTLARLLEPGGEIFLQTDVEDRALAFRDAIAASSDFELSGADGFVVENPFGGRSNREVRAEADGLPIHRILARRRAAERG